MKNLVILGTGFAAFSLLKRVSSKFYDVTVVSPRNHFLFTPLLPSTTTGTVEFRSIIEPVRIAKKGIRFHQAFCTAIDAAQNRIDCQSGIDGRLFSLPYDFLVIAVGAVNNTFGIPGVSEHALFLKELSDARAIRQKIIECFERASVPGISRKEQVRLLHFVVVGGGPTGIEFAAEMHDFLERDLRRWYPELMDEFKITILEATDEILSTFDDDLAAYTLKVFRRHRIEVKTKSIVRKVLSAAIELKDGSQIPYGLLVWSTGIGPPDLVKNLPFPKAGWRLATDPHFHVQNSTNIFAIGDCATPEGQNLPATAQVAEQEGKYLARLLNRSAQGKNISVFKYHHMGMLAYIGNNRALADLPKVKGKGYVTWLFWRSAYITRLVSLKNKILVLFDWFKTRIFGRDISSF